MDEFQPPATVVKVNAGRPEIVPADGGKPVRYTRATTYIDCLDDKSNLAKYASRQMLRGLIFDPTILDEVRSLLPVYDDRKTDINNLARRAQDLGDVNQAAAWGTKVHAYTEVLDAGGTLADIPNLDPDAVADLKAYQCITEGLVSLSMEQRVVLDALGVTGTPDRVLSIPVSLGFLYPAFHPLAGQPFSGNVIGDLKTGGIEYGLLKIAMQLSIYSRSVYYEPLSDGTARRTPLQDVSQDLGLIVHLPMKSAYAELVWVDLARGWRAVEVATAVRAERRGVAKLGASIRRVQLDGAPKAGIFAAIAATASREDCLAIHAAHSEVWTPAHTGAVKAHLATLAAAA